MIMELQARPRAAGAGGVRRPVLHRFAAFLAALVGALVLVPLLASPAAAVDEDIHGRLQAEQGGPEREPVAGVKITVVRPGGEPVGEAVTDDKGEWLVKLPGPGTYEVTIDTSTLPEGVDLRDPNRTTVTSQIGPDQKRPLLFPLGEGQVVERQNVDRVVQLVAEGIRFGLILALAAVGLSLIYGTTGLVNFAHGELVTLGAMVAFWFNIVLDLHLLVAAPLALVVCAAIGSGQDRFFWGRLRRRGTGLNSMMIISIGVALLVRYIYLFFFGGGNSAYAEYRGQAAVDLGGFPVRLAERDYWSMAVAAVVLTATLLALTRTRLGKATRAVADNPALAAASGIDVDRVIRLVWTAGTVLAGLAGILLGLAQQVNFQMGFDVLLLMFAAVTLGGLGTATGALVGTLVVTVFIQLSTLVVSPELKYVGALGVLIVILMIRPQGMLGRAQRVG
jgi:neutral amino acid transport system permease protein